VSRGSYRGANTITANITNSTPSHTHSVNDHRVMSGQPPRHNAQPGPTRPAAARNTTSTPPHPHPPPPAPHPPRQNPPPPPHPTSQDDGTAGRAPQPRQPTSTPPP